MASKKNGQPLRFAALIRVSTEQQERVGESLRVQKKDIREAVERLGGKIVGWYGGQEHATPGYEKKEIDRLVRDAQKNKFDAVMVAHADRWSRDNSKSREGLEVFKKHKVAFYVESTCYDLYNPEHEFFLGMSAVVGRFQAQHQNRKSMLSRINRAKRGIPTAGKRPFGRSFNRKTERWEVDAKTKAMVEDVAKRYLAGEPLPDLAREYGVNHSNLHKTLMQRCGPDWSISFDSDELNIHEVVPFKIPPLLDAKTIKALHAQANANKTYLHGKPKYPYLLSGMVFCGHCGYAMFGQTNHKRIRYYRHAHTHRVRNCPCNPKPWVRCDELEDVVLRHLFECFGNPEAVQRAIEEATPNREEVERLRERLAGRERDLAKIKTARERILRLISNDAITDAQAEGELQELAQRETKLIAARDQLQDRLGHMPSGDAIKTISIKVSAAFREKFHVNGKRVTIKYQNAKLAAKKRLANSCFEEMTWEEKRALAKLVFSGQTADGKPMGVYITTIDGQTNFRHKRWRFTLHGQAINGTQLVTPHALH